MPYQVTIPKTHAEALRFPPRCVACGAADPDGVARVRTFSLAMKPLNEDVFKSFTGDLPACAGCQGGVRRARFLNQVLTGVTGVLAVVVIAPLLALFGDRLGTIGGGLVLLVGVAMAMVLKTRLYTPPADFDGRNDDLVFTFRDQAFAEAFAQLNGVTAEDTPVV